MTFNNVSVATPDCTHPFVIAYPTDTGTQALRPGAGLAPSAGMAKAAV